MHTLRAHDRLARRAGPLLFLTLFFTVVESAEAVPAFARRYGVPCHFCHEGFPKLSVIGEQFKERGYRLQRDDFAWSEWLKSVPVTLRAGVNQSFVEEGEATTSGFFKVLSAGSLGSRVSYWMDHNWFALEDDFVRFGTDNGWGRVELIPDELYVRGGRFELDLPFTQARSPHLFGYDIYFVNTGFETDNIGQHQDGLEVGGFLTDATRWSVALVKGRNSELAESITPEADDFDGNLFGRIQHRFGENRIGAFLHFGRNTLARTNPAANGPPDLVWDNDYLRLGGDASWYVARLNLYGVFLHGRDDNSIADPENPEGTGETLTYTGGFAQADYLLRDELILSARLNLVRRPPGTSALPHQTLASFFPGLKVYFHPQFRLAFELGFQNEERPTLGAIQAEVAF